MKNKSVLLIKANLVNSYSIQRILKAPKKERMRITFVLIAIIFLACLIVTSISSYYLYFSKMLMDMGKIDMLLTLSFLTVNIMGLMVSVFKGSSYLFAFKDFEFLATLPVKNKDILLSKIFLIYLSNIIFSIFFLLPAIVIYGISTSSSYEFYFLAGISILIVPIIPMLFGVAISLIWGKIASNFKHRNMVLLITTFLLIIILAIGNCFFQWSEDIKINDAFIKLDQFKDNYFLAKLFVEGLSEINIGYYFLFIAFNIAVFVLFLYVFSKKFRAINALMIEHSNDTNYEISTLKTCSPFIALYKKEIKNYFSSYIYVLNTISGLMLFTVYLLSIILFQYEKVLDVLEMGNLIEYILPFTTVIAISCVIMSCTTGSSISIEGINLWIIKSSPLEFRSIAKCKVLVNFTLTMPFMFLASIVVLNIFKLTVLEYVSYLFPVFSYCILSALIGLIVNLLYPKLDWKSDVEVIKQSIATLVTLLINGFSIILPIAILYIVKPLNYSMFFISIGIIALVCCVILWNYITIKGSNIFKKLTI